VGFLSQARKVSYGYCRHVVVPLKIFVSEYFVAFLASD